MWSVSHECNLHVSHISPVPVGQRQERGGSPVPPRADWEPGYSVPARDSRPPWTGSSCQHSAGHPTGTASLQTDTHGEIGAGWQCWWRQWVKDKSSPATDLVQPKSSGFISTRFPDFCYVNHCWFFHYFGVIKWPIQCRFCVSFITRNKLQWDLNMYRYISLKKC